MAEDKPQMNREGTMQATAKVYKNQVCFRIDRVIRKWASLSFLQVYVIPCLCSTPSDLHSILDNLYFKNNENHHASGLLNSLSIIGEKYVY